MKAAPYPPHGFVLLEALLAVAIFAIGVLALGRCVSNCVAAEHLKLEDTRARQALENRMAEIRAGAVPAAEARREKLSSPFQGLTLQQSSAPLTMRDERQQELAGLSIVTLEVSWPSRGETHVRTQTFYADARPR